MTDLKTIPGVGKNMAEHLKAGSDPFSRGEAGPVLSLCLPPGGGLGRGAL